MKFFVRAAGFFYASILFYIFFLARRRPHPTFLMHNEPVNLIPLKAKLAQISIYHSLSSVERWELLTDLFGNIILFIPLPFFFSVVFKIESAGKIILYAFILSICVEVTQFIFSIGVADIDDILLNTLGAIIGVFMLNMLKKILPGFYHSLQA